jgi:signal transduction histidine kinase
MLLLLLFSVNSREMAPGDLNEHGMVAALVTVIGVGVLRNVAPKMPMQGLWILGFLLFWIYALGLYSLSFFGVCWWSGVLLVSFGLLLFTLICAPFFAQLSRGAIYLLIFLVVCLLRDFLSINIGLIDEYVRSSPWVLSLMAPGYFFVYGVVIAFWVKMAPVFSIYPRLFRIVLHQYKSLRESAKKHWVTSNVSYLERMNKKEREVILAERSAIYRELHDGVSSQLVALLFSVKGGSASLTALEAGLARCLNQIKAILMGAAMDHGKSVQDVFFDYCFGLDDLFSDGHLIFEYSIEGGDYCFLDNSTHDLLKIFQEAVANALKHSGARKLHLFLRMGDADLRVVFIESEFSSGPPLTHVASSGVGLLSQQRRAEQIGAEFSCRHTAEMRVTSVRVPLLMV